jgi:hypothetical protein
LFQTKENRISNNQKPIFQTPKEITFQTEKNLISDPKNLNQGGMTKKIK